MRYPPVLPAEGQRIQRERAADRLIIEIASRGGWDPEIDPAVRARLLQRWDSIAITEADIDALEASWAGVRPLTTSGAIAQLINQAWL